MTLNVRKFSGVFQLSRDHAIDLGLVKPTTAELRQREEWRVEYEARKAAASAAWPPFIAALAAVTDPVGRAVLDLHKADSRGGCMGCEGSDNDGEAPAWPCATTIVVAEKLGITVPEDLDMADQARQW